MWVVCSVALVVLSCIRCTEWWTSANLMSCGNVSAPVGGNNQFCYGSYGNLWTLDAFALFFSCTVIHDMSTGTTITGLPDRGPVLSPCEPDAKKFGIPLHRLINCIGLKNFLQTLINQLVRSDWLTKCSCYLQRSLNLSPAFAEHKPKLDSFKTHISFLKMLILFFWSLSAHYVFPLCNIKNAWVSNIVNILKKRFV